MTDNKKFKSGFVALIGKPNAGKSTLLNKIFNNKIAIVTNKPQTTREQISGVYNSDDSQIIFLDTPGIHKSEHYLGKLMNKQATAATKGTELLCLLVPANKRIDNNDQHIIKILKEREVPIFLLLTKVDLVKKTELLHKINEWKDLLNFVEIIPISALTNLNVDLFLKKVKSYLPVGPKYYDKATTTNSCSEYFIKEIIREKIIILTKQEIPYSVAIIINRIDNSKVLTIDATIIVERKSQKGIIIGKKGQMLKQIGTDARLELESYWHKTIMLKLFVKVIDEWVKKPIKSLLLESIDKYVT